MPGSMSAHLGTRRAALLALRRRIPPARQPAEAFRLPGAVVAGARFAHSRHPNERGDQPLGFVFILPRVKARWRHQDDAHKALTARERHAGCAGVSRCAVVGRITKVNAA
jgi:hypothetical protein